MTNTYAIFDHKGILLIMPSYPQAVKTRKDATDMFINLSVSVSQRWEDFEAKGFTCRPVTITEYQNFDRQDAMEDMAYLNGLRAGYNLGIRNDEAGFAEAQKCRDGYLAVLKNSHREDT